MNSVDLDNIPENDIFRVQKSAYFMDSSNLNLNLVPTNPLSFKDLMRQRKKNYTNTNVYGLNSINSKSKLIKADHENPELLKTTHKLIIQNYSNKL